MTSAIPISLITRFITSTGQGEPAITPVRRLDRSVRWNAASASSAMNMVGTPYRAVHRSCSTAARVAAGSKPWDGMTTQAPCVSAPRLPSTLPKQW